MGTSLTAGNSKRILTTIVIVLLCMFLLPLTACSNAKNALIGKWELQEGEKGWYEIIFYEDGELGGITNREYYSVLSDGTLKLQDYERQTKKTLKKVNSKEPDSSDEYYVKGNTLIFEGAEYKKVK